MTDDTFEKMMNNAMYGKGNGGRIEIDVTEIVKAAILKRSEENAAVYEAMPISAADGIRFDVDPNGTMVVTMASKKHGERLTSTINRNHAVTMMIQVVSELMIAGINAMDIPDDQKELLVKEMNDEISGLS